MAEYLQDRKAVTITTLNTLREQGEKITMLTCYDASFAALMDRCGVEIILVGDSLGMVVQGHSSTVPVTVDEIAYHTRCVAQGKRTAFLIADMPFGSYQESPEQAFRNAVTLMALPTWACVSTKVLSVAPLMAVPLALASLVVRLQS